MLRGSEKLTQTNENIDELQMCGQCRNNMIIILLRGSGRLEKVGVTENLHGRISKTVSCRRGL